MNHENDDAPRFDDPAREHEWQAQEGAMRRERLNLDPARDDARTLSYRLLTRALRVEPSDGLPKDFARQISALAAESKPVPAATFETILTITLASVLVLSAIASTVAYSAKWWPALARWLLAPSIAQWLMALIGCVALTWLVGAGSRFFTGAANLQ